MKAPEQPGPYFNRRKTMAQTTQEQAVQAASFLGCDASELVNPFDLSAIVSSKGFGPMKVVIYGVAGIGKTTFAGTFPSPILMRIEDGAAALDIPTFPRVITNLLQLDMAIAALRGDHQFKTLIIDSLDWLEPLVWQYVCTKEGKENIEDFGYGKGYIKVDDVWRAIQAKLEKLRTLRGMNIVTIAHAVPVTFDPPDSEMHFSTLSVSACTLRTRFAVFGLPTLFFIALSCPLLYHQYSILSTKNQLFHTEYPEMSVIFPFHRASRTMSDSDSQKRINAFRQIHLFDIFRIFT